MRLAAVILLGCGLTVGACSSGGEAERPGDPAVYDEIEATTDCGELQEGFDRNMADVERREPGEHLRDVTLAYADAYDEQLEASGCYG